MKIVILDGYSVHAKDLNWDLLRPLGELTVYDRTSADQVIARMQGAEIVLTNKCRITREVLEACPALRYLGELATGYNNIDIAAAKERGVVVTNIPGYSTVSVVQHVFALLLYAMSHVISSVVAILMYQCSPGHGVYSCYPVTVPASCRFVFDKLVSFFLGNFCG